MHRLQTGDDTRCTVHTLPRQLVHARTIFMAAAPEMRTRLKYLGLQSAGARLWHADVCGRAHDARPDPRGPDPYSFSQGLAVLMLSSFAASTPRYASVGASLGAGAAAADMAKGAADMAS
jgi:hypothetical protein